MSSQPAPTRASRVSVTSLRMLKAEGIPITMITAYDHPSARLAEQAGVDAILVGDSLGMTVLGHPSTLQVTMDDMVRHTAAVSRATERALVIADMPFMSYQPSTEVALVNAGRLLAEGGAHAVKIEGAGSNALMVIEELVEAGIPAMGHVGLTPQSVNALGGYRTQATDAEAAARLMEDCASLEEAGAFAIVLECIPAELATVVSATLSIPTIGIGAGVGCDGQVQVFHDVLGLGERTPRHAKVYADVATQIRDAIMDYVSDVKATRFPAEENSVHVDRAVVEEAVAIYAQGVDEDDFDDFDDEDEDDER